ncbi:RNA polymerase sigma factor [Bordetella holmesii]|uniref:Sigma-70, region 4 n=3 Tax=Bordetella holmesii TaxID=35814 RepID=A0A158M0M7_9BORD|nr:RNA polymerase sigma factor [Bordetella holmesii]AHV93623.1 RNA polymerase sigma factor, sigma-70 family protein [Bordetella holmesii ATCC 51541]AIT28021.1 RNA polymerase sigma factor, sigma-70 family protein [Bordetella holmesii 44057]EWM40796.1 RNA polymerase sigma factor, sigma-70 family protein [Bordetella holmesii 35009]EWM41976.1 RNA polymerase sigma factor, sigma-70 family protein [Bordetella holmesii 41130]EWM44695.1 RNA polymerase sigma factor, sigma-70 family protein [Bordetella h
MKLADTVATHYRELVDFLSRRTGSRDSAQDCAQETWLKLAGMQAVSAPISNVRAYVFQVAANLAIDMQRRQTAENRNIERYAQFQLPGATSPDTAEIAALRQVIARLEAAILAQPLRTRQIFLLHKIDGQSYADIAQALGVSLKTIEKHMTRVLLACRLAMAQA